VAPPAHNSLKAIHAQATPQKPSSNEEKREKKKKKKQKKKKKKKKNKEQKEQELFDEFKNINPSYVQSFEKTRKKLRPHKVESHQNLFL
jgi:hypothetical protein